MSAMSDMDEFEAAIQTDGVRRKDSARSASQREGMIERLPIGPKLLAMFGVVIALVLFAAVALLMQFHALRDTLEVATPDIEAARTLARQAQEMILILGLVCVAVIVFLVVRVTRHIGHAVRNLTDSAERLLGGETDIAIPYLERSDELGDIARALAIFQRGTLHYMKLRSEAAAKAEAALEEERAREREREELRNQQVTALMELADSFEGTVGEVVGGVAAASTQLQSTASTMADAAEKSARQTAEVASAMEEASSGVTAAAAASDEFAMSINEISRQAATSAELARKATLSAEEADVTISNLSVSADQVSQIVELISSIAQRTNLLALNASIEAARGGEAGRGFAVVASEVKDLAMQTGKATEDVAAQVRAMQDSTQASVGALRTIGEQIQQLEATAVSIASAVDQQSVAGQDLARSIDLAARSSDTVSVNIEEVRDATSLTGSAASQVLFSANELEGQAATLRDQVARFLAQIRKA